MKVLSIILLTGYLFVSPWTLSASCYSDFLVQGINAFEKLEFNSAIDNFEAAKICSGITRKQKNTVERWLNKARTGYIDAISNARDEALRAKFEAQQMALTSEANRLAFIAGEEIENGNAADAINLAYRALTSSAGLPSPAVSKAFGDAVYANYHITLSGHTAPLIDVVTSDDGRYLLSLAQDHEAILWNEEGEELVRLSHGKAIPFKAYFAPDGQTILTLASDNVARLWDMQGKLMSRLAKHKARINMARFSADANMIVTASRDGNIFLWDRDGNEIAGFDKHKAAIKNLQFSLIDNRILSCDGDKSAFLWNTRGEMIADLSQDVYIIDAKYSRAGNQILVHGASAEARLYNQDGNLIQTFDTHAKGVVSFDYAPNQDYLFTADLNGVLSFWQADGSQQQPFETLYQGIRNVNFSPDGEYLVINSINEDASLYTRSGDRIRRLDKHSTSISSVEFASDGASVLTLGQDGTAKLWDMSGRLLMNVAPESKLYSATFQAQNNQLIFVGEKQYLTLCPSPQLIIAQLKTEPLAPLSQEKREKYSLETSKN